MIQPQKKEVRKKVRFKIKTLTPTQKQIQAEAVFSKIEKLPEFENAKTIMHYWSLLDEIPTHNWIEKWSIEKQILLPVIQGQNLIIKPFEGIEKMEPDPQFNIPEPTGQAIKDPTPDIIIIPGVAFDSKCNRLGRGKGFYDRFLSKLQSPPILIGVCFDEQIVPEAPTEDHDFKLDMVITANYNFQSPNYKRSK